MALIKCKECKKEISDKAEKCPNCGCLVSEMVSSEIVKIKMPEKPEYSTGLMLYSIITILVLGMLTLNAIGVSIQYNQSIFTDLISGIFLICFFVLIPNLIYYSDYKKLIEQYEEDYNLAQNDYKEYENKIKIQEEQRKIIQKELEKSLEIDYTILVSEDSKKSVGSAVVRGAIGGAVLGPVGLAAGALSGKNKSKTTFTVVYKDGHREVVTVDNDTSDFRKYASYLK